VAEVLLFHHALGLTPGVQAFAGEISAAGHTVHTPDLYEGATFRSVADGVAHAKSIGFDVIMERGREVASLLRPGLVYGGFSLGVVPAQMLVQTRPGARGALFFHGAIPTSEFDGPWPAGVPLQIHTMENDEMGDIDVARDLAASIEGAELYVYAGDSHLFTDSGSADYDETATKLVMSRVLAFLERAG